MKGASVKVAILSFFSSHGLYFHHAKNQPLLRPPSPFSEHLPLFWPYLFSKKFYETFLVQNLGHNHLKKCNICCLGGLLKEKRESTSDLFSTFQKPYWPSCPIVQWLLPFHQGVASLLWSCSLSLRPLNLHLHLLKPRHQLLVIAAAIVAQEREPAATSGQLPTKPPWQRQPLAFH